MHILYVNKTSPFTKGGDLRLWEIARRLVSRGHEVSVVCGRNLPGLPKRQLVDGVCIHNVTVLPSWMFRFQTLSFFLARYLFYFASIPAIFRSARKVDIVVDVATPAISGAGMISKLLKKPCVVTIYGMYGRSWFKLHGPVTATLGHLTELYFSTQKHDAYVTLSQHTVDKLVNYGKPPDRIYHQRYGVGFYRPSSPVKAGGKEKVPEVAYLSRLSKQKNVASLLRAWIATAELGQARLRIMGDGPERRNLEKLTSTLSISDSVIFEGLVSEGRKWELLDRASVFAFPSTREGFPIVVLEAMAAGLPVVAYDLPAFRGFLNDGEHGFLAPLDDHRPMADRLLELLQNGPLRREISRRNAEYARRFTWERATDQEENTLLDVLTRWRGKSHSFPLTISAGSAAMKSLPPIPTYRNEGRSAGRTSI